VSHDPKVRVVEDLVTTPHSSLDCDDVNLLNGTSRFMFFQHFILLVYFNSSVLYALFVNKSEHFFNGTVLAYHG